jgi:hypothetical protein
MTGAFEGRDHVTAPGGSEVVREETAITDNEAKNHSLRVLLGGEVKVYQPSKRRRYTSAKTAGLTRDVDMYQILLRHRVAGLERRYSPTGTKVVDAERKTGVRNPGLPVMERGRDIADALKGLIEDGLAKAYLLSGAMGPDPFAGEFPGVPPLDVEVSPIRRFPLRGLRKMRPRSFVTSPFGREVKGVPAAQKEENRAPPDPGVEVRKDYGIGGGIEVLIDAFGEDHDSVEEEKDPDEEPDGNHVFVVHGILSLTRRRYSG